MQRLQKKYKRRDKTFRYQVSKRLTKDIATQQAKKSGLELSNHTQQQNHKKLH